MEVVKGRTTETKDGRLINFDVIDKKEDRPNSVYGHTTYVYKIYNMGEFTNEELKETFEPYFFMSVEKIDRDNNTLTVRIDNVD